MPCLRTWDFGSPPGAKMLDFGCGSGRMVRSFLDKGYDTYGADIEEFWLLGDEKLNQPPWPPDDLERFGRISLHPYRLPFEDNTFDFCCSTVVFEHVQNFKEAFAEIKRVLKPGGATLHIFPSRYLPVEPHLHVPLAALFQSSAYLSIWARLGIRNEHQQGMTWQETTRYNVEWLKTNVNYVTARQIEHDAMQTFGNIQFPHRSYVKHGYGKAGKLGRSLPFPFFSQLAFTFFRRVIFMRKT